MQNPNQILIEIISEQVAEQNLQFAAISQAFNNDYRQKGQFLIQYFPWPIGVEIRRLLSADRLVQDNMRMEQIFKLTERSIQFLSFCLLADLWNNIEKDKSLVTPEIQEQIKQLSKPSMGTWVGLIRSSFKTLNQIEKGAFFDYQAINNKKIVYYAEQLVQHRNRIIHTAEVADFDVLEELLANLIQKLAFLTTYKMVTVKDIRVFCPRFSSPLFQHNFSLLNSTHVNFGAEKLDYSDFTESHSVLLMQDFKKTHTYLNLYPFVIDTTPFAEENNKLTKGVFMYIGSQNNKLVYVGTDPVINIDFSQYDFGKHIMGKLNLFTENFVL